MFTHVHIQNFRGLSKAQHRACAGHSLIGPNSCGKTTVHQAVRLACDVEFARKEGDLRVEKWLDIALCRPSDSG